mmetsp:Transcript_64466/g.127442  ORF Transcript_64466/g.127442 Transcript_64466/m.127442 type:complete len:122 (+) Transcript_64466:2247-2612(+)
MRENIVIQGVLCDKQLQKWLQCLAWQLGKTPKPDLLWSIVDETLCQLLNAELEKRRDRIHHCNNLWLRSAVPAAAVASADVAVGRGIRCAPPTTMTVWLAVASGWSSFTNHAAEHGNAYSL